MIDHDFKFPSTPHLTIHESMNIRDDKVMSENERQTFLQNKIVVEEKVDGANLGIFFDAEGNICALNRGTVLGHNAKGQWNKLNEWLESRQDILFEQLTDQYTLFGEWCYAKHSIFYNQLPDWFLGFDIYDHVNGRFLSCSFRNRLNKLMGIVSVPFLGYGYFSLPELRNMVAQSKIGDDLAEGLYLRYDQEEWLMQRAKLVRPGFVQSIGTHWSKSKIIPNRLIKDQYQY